MKTNKIALQGLATAAPVFEPPTAADLSGLAPFVGCWHAHEEGLDIQTYADKSTCPDAPAAGCGKTATVDFTLTSVSGDTANGAGYRRQPLRRRRSCRRGDAPHGGRARLRGQSTEHRETPFTAQASEHGRQNGGQKSDALGGARRI
jgi:hypothetical protein